MDSPSDKLAAAVRAAFPEARVADVLHLLEAYGTESYERESERVRIAIVALSDGDETKLRQFVAAAKRDYRDVLFWAEHPDESRLDTPEKRRALREMFEKFGVELPDALKE
jgi:hypothetical protein